MTRKLVLPAVIVSVTFACGSGTEQTPPARLPQAEPELSGPPAPPAGTLWRHDVRHVVAGGLGRFLAHVEVEPSLSNGRFVGFRIVELRPPEFWRGVDLRPGDVVTRVNGKPIERETQAFDVFESLKEADRLTVSYLRGGQERELSYRIADAPD